MVLMLLSTPFSRKLFWPFERTPLAEKPPLAESRAPGSAGTTPGESRARYVRLRVPPKGTSVTVLCPAPRRPACFRSGAAAPTQPLRLSGRYRRLTE